VGMFIGCCVLVGVFVVSHGVMSPLKYWDSFSVD